MYQKRFAFLLLNVAPENMRDLVASYVSPTMSSVDVLVNSSGTTLVFEGTTFGALNFAHWLGAVRVPVVASAIGDLSGQLTND